MTMPQQLHDHDAEVALLAACVTSKPARVEARRHITGEDFYEPWHEEVWQAMSRLDRHAKAVDAPILHSVLPAGSRAQQSMTDILLTVGIPEHVADYAAIVRSWATKRRIAAEATRVAQQAMNPDASASGMAASVVNRFAAIRDAGNGAEDITARLVSELLAEADDEPDWLVPGLLERRDRLMLTGEEGLGKSHLLRQIAILAAAGVTPFQLRSCEPIRTLIVDAENTWRQVRRKVRPTVDWLTHRMGHDPSDRMMVDCTDRMDLARDRDISRVHRLLDTWQPDLVVIGPLYRLAPRALQTDDDTAPILAALDTIRERGCAVLIEAHAGHAIGKGGVRDLRPRGSSSLMGWPEFGFGLRSIAGGFADVVPWRGQREERSWPDRIKHYGGIRWVPTDESYVEAS